MVLLRRGTLEKVQVFTPESMQLMLGEKDSTATLSLGPDAPELILGDWLLDDTDPGKGIVWRVKSLDTAYQTKTRTVQLEHMIQSLKDKVIPGEVGASAMGGGSTVSPAQAARYVLGKQNIWTLGTCSYTGSYPYEFNGEDLFSALETVCSALEDSRWRYDMSALPFKISIVHRSENVGAEMRAGRNLSTLSRSVDKGRMYTRIYPIGASDLRLSGSGYIERNTGKYGEFEKTETDQSQDTEAKLRMWAEGRLRRHSEPTVTITANGLSLSEATGEDLDKLEIGRICRIPVPELGEVMAEEITRLQWKDKLMDTQNVTVTLANNREDVASIYRRDQGAAEKSGRSGARAGGGVKKDLENKVEDTANGLMTTIIRTAAEITQQAKDTKNQLESEIKQTASEINMSVKNVKKDLEARIKITEDQINMTVKKGSVISEINQSAEAIKIKASKIELDGDVIASAISGHSLRFGNVNCTTLTASRMDLARNSSAGDFRFENRDVGWQTLTVDSYTLSTAHNFMYTTSGDNYGTVSGRVVTASSTKTIYYLGR